MNADPSQITDIIYATVLAVGLMLSAAGLGSALAWGIISSKTLEGITRQPEMQPQLMVNTFIFAGLMESFPFILFGVSMWFVFANPFMSALGS